jgi:small subunit ribosomal protein SAe
MATDAIHELKKKDVERMLAANVHLGSKNKDSQMEPYIWKKAKDQTNLLHLGKTLEKIKLAARIIVAVENPADVMVISAREYGQRAVLKFAQYTGATAIAGRFTPGAFTNQIIKQYREPAVMICTDPRNDSQAITEASFVGLPCIAFCDSDSPLKFVDVAIPGNNKGKYSIGLLYWMLAREVLRLRGEIGRDEDWNVAVDLFFYRDAEEMEKLEEERARGANEEVQDSRNAPAQTGGEKDKQVYEGTGAGFSELGGEFPAGFSAAAQGDEQWTGNAGEEWGAGGQ